MRILGSVAPPTLAIGALLVLGAGLWRGGDGALGAAVGVVVTVVFLGSSPGLLTPVARRSPVAALPVALGFFLVKAAVALALLRVLLDADGARRHLDVLCLGLAVVATSLVWVAFHLRTLRRDRTPLYDLPDIG